MAAYKRIKSPRNPSKGIYVPYRGGPISSAFTGLRFAPSEARPISCSEFGTTPTGDTVKIHCFTTLPPVLALHLNRTSQLKGTDGIKISGHVRFMEYFDVKRFMDPRYQ
jgi:hypothetical protein